VLQDLPDDNWFEVQISEDVAGLTPCKTPSDFRVQYCWSQERGGLERHISHGAAYAGHACFISGQRFWHVTGTSAQDEAFLDRELVDGEGILELATRRNATWRKRGLPYQCRLRYVGSDALTVHIGQVTEQALELLVDWRVNPASIEPIASLQGYVVADGILMRGVAPQALFQEPPNQHSTRRILSQDVPVFMADMWSSLKPFCKGPTDELRTHRTVPKAGPLVIELQSRPARGIGSPAAVPVLTCEGHRVPAEELSRQIEVTARYVRVPTGWLGVESLAMAGVGPLGRAADGTALQPIDLSPAEVLMRGSARVEGPWDAIEPSDFDLPKSGPAPEATARSHLEWQLQWAIPGGIVGQLDKYAPVLEKVLAALTGRAPDARILIVCSKQVLSSLGAGWARMVSQRFEGKASDPKFKARGGVVVLAASRAVESTPPLQRAKWDLLCLVGADGLIKSNRSKLYEALSRFRARLTVGLFSSADFLTSRVKNEAMSAVFGLSPGPASPLVWTSGLRDPLAPAPSLPGAYRLKGRRAEAEPAAAQLAVHPAPGAPAATPIPAKTGAFLISATTGEQEAGERFVAAARELARRGGRRAPFVPFHCYWPTYGDMTEDQLRWYLYWRGQVREGQYYDTDLSYIFVHVYELLNDVGVHDAADGLGKLTGLFCGYRDRYPKLADYLVDWIADYIVVNRLPEEPLNVYREATEAGFEQRDVDLPLAACIARPLHEMPIVLVDQLTDYKIRKGKFYGMGNAEMVDRHMGLAFEQVNEYMAEQSGRGIFDLFRPCPPQPVRRSPFQSALYAGDTREVTIARVIPYSQHPPLREFLTGVAKYTENRLRARQGYSGRLRGMVIGPAIMALLDRMIPLGEDARQPAAVRRQVTIDHGRVEALIKESDQLLATLLSDVEAASHTPLSKLEPSLAPRRPKMQRPAGTPDGLLTDLDPVSDVLKGATPQEREVLQALAGMGWEANETALADALGGVLVEPTIDRINSLSLEFLGDFLIASEDGCKVVAEDYRDELEHLLPKPEGVGRVPSSQIGLAPEWVDLRRELADYQLKALSAMVRGENPMLALQQLAASRGLMPEMLIDSINELALSMVGDLLIAPDDVPPAICQESAEAVKQMLGSTTA